jgi:hypothetical protein
MSNADKTILIVSYSCRSFPLWLNGWAKSKVRAFTRRMFRQIWTELAELGNTASNYRRQKQAQPDYPLLRVRETQSAGQRPKSRMVCRRGLRSTGSFSEWCQTDEKRARFPSPTGLPHRRTKEDENGLFAQARQR